VSTTAVTNLNADMVDGKHASELGGGGLTTAEGDARYVLLGPATIQTTSSAFAISVESTATGGKGVYGKASGVLGTGVYGKSDHYHGVHGESDGSGITGIGVFGLAASTESVNYGGYFETNSPVGYGVYGKASTGYGVYGDAVNIGVYGKASGSSGTGVYGESYYGVHGYSTYPSGKGVYGQSTAPSGYGVYGENISTGYSGYFTGGKGVKVVGTIESTALVSAETFQSTVTTGTAPFVVESTTLVTNLNADMIDGKHASELGGLTTAEGDARYVLFGPTTVQTTSSAAAIQVESTANSAISIYGQASATGAFNNYGGYFTAAGDDGRGVYGAASGASGRGVYGFATATGAVTNAGGQFQADGDSGVGVQGIATATGGTNYGGNFWGAGESGYGVRGVATGASGRGVYGMSTGTTNPYGGFFESPYTGAYGKATLTGSVINWGGLFEAEGDGGRAVAGYANASGEVTNYGGYFQSAGNTGYGVFGWSTGTSGRGVYGVSSGTSGYGIYGENLSNGYAGYFTGGKGVKVEGTIESTVSTGIAPFLVSSETLVVNLNADMVDGKHASELGGLTTAEGDARYVLLGPATIQTTSSAFAVSLESTASTGVGVYGRASATGNYDNYGGYFSAAGDHGRGVYGEAPAYGVYGEGTETGSVLNYGGYFVTAGNVGQAVAGYANATGNYTNYGGYFQALGDTGSGVQGIAAGTGGKGVQGKATQTGAYTNYGGYFSAAGNAGRGVYGTATATGSAASNYGGYFSAHGDISRGVYAEALGPYGIGVFGMSSGSSGYGIYGQNNSSGYSGYFSGGWGVKVEGSLEVTDRVGIGTTEALYKLTVHGENDKVIYGYLNETNTAADGRAAIYGYRTSSTRNDGSDFGFNTTNNAITGYNVSGEVFTFGVGGFCNNDLGRTGGVIGAHYQGDYFGALGYKDENYKKWGGYFDGEDGVYASKLQVQDKTPFSYSRFGAGLTGHGLSNAWDVLISGKLEVNGPAYLDGGYSDIAELIKVNGAAEAGDVLVVDPDHDEMAKPCSKPYDASIIGVISESPSLLVSGGLEEKDAKPLALCGRVKVKVSVENGPIRRGDLLATSSTPGHAMKATKPGFIIGKAMQNFDGSSGKTGMITVFVNITWYGGEGAVSMVNSERNEH
jgi:hypothetical protein